MLNQVQTKSQTSTATFYAEKIRLKKLNGSLEYAATKVAWQFALALGAVLLLAAFDFETTSFSIPMLAAALVFVFEGLYCYWMAACLRRDLMDGDSVISPKTRRMGALPLIFLLTGNFFAAIAGAMTLKKEKGIEYQLGVYSVMTLILITLVSALNMLKSYVANTYYIGMGLLLVLIVVNLAFLLLSNRWVNGRSVDKHMVVFAVLSILQICYGNLFGFAFGLIILTKYRRKDQEISIEWVDIIRRLFRNHMAVIGLFVVVFLITLSVFSVLTFDYAIAVDNDYINILKAPSLAFPFGTDNFGRCVFTRIVFGARISLTVGILATVLPILVGGTLGAIAGYYGKRTDNTIMRGLDILYAVPSILLAITIVAAFGVSTTNLILALSVGSIPIYARTVRATVMSVSRQEFVEAARASGARNGYIILGHIIPNSLAPVIVRATLEIGAAVLSTSALSYLGLGVEPQVPEWGNILKVGSSYLETNPYIAIFPGLAIVVIVLAFNYFGDGLRDALDPKLK